MRPLPKWEWRSLGSGTGASQSGRLASQPGTRGFTGHAQLANVGVVHMNGRVYDPLIGRFGSADPTTEDLE